MCKYLNIWQVLKKYIESKKLIIIFLKRKENSEEWIIFHLKEFGIEEIKFLNIWSDKKNRSIIYHWPSKYNKKWYHNYYYYHYYCWLGAQVEKEYKSRWVMQTYEPMW